MTQLPGSGTWTAARADWYVQAASNITCFPRQLLPARLYADNADNQSSLLDK